MSGIRKPKIVIKKYKANSIVDRRYSVCLHMLYQLGIRQCRPWQIIDGDVYPFLTTYELPFMAKSGSTVVKISSTSSVKLFTLEQLNSMFGQSYTSASNYHIFAMNGDGNASAAHLNGVTVIGTDYYAVLDRNVNGSFRVNWMVFCAVSNA